MRDFVKLGWCIAAFLFFSAFSSASAASIYGVTTINQHVVAEGDSVYQVQQGDTYYSLARRYKIPLDSLRSWNGPELKIGQMLYLTRKEAVRAKVTSRKSANTRSNSAGTSAARFAPTSTSYTVAENKTKKRVLVVPFDPYLYFSDADDEIAYQSHIPRQNVRHAFRGRLNTMLDPEGYETIHLLGGVFRDSVSELSRLYGSLSYGYQDNKQSKYNLQPQVKNDEKGGVLNWVQEQKSKLSGVEKGPVPVAKDPNKHFGVKVKDPALFGYFNNEYDIDYYVFINQFEVKTVYENCLDRAAQNYQRDFLVHYSIYDNKGQLVSGNKVKVFYQSNINSIDRIVSDTMPAMAKRVLADLPPPGK